MDEPERRSREEVEDQVKGIKQGMVETKGPPDAAAKPAHAGDPSSYGVLPRGDPNPFRSPSSDGNGEVRYSGTRSGVSSEEEDVRDGQKANTLQPGGREDDFPTAEMSGVVRSERRRGGQGGYSTAEERSSGRGAQGGQGKVRSRPTGTLTDTEGLLLSSSLGGKGFQGGQGKVPSRLTGT